ncbi:MAG: hypothetical protein WBN64_03905 [Candidatus Deferrimicrobium sp.]
MILLGILSMMAALAWLWWWLVRHETEVRHRWEGLAAHPRVTALRTRFAPQIAFLQARLSPAEFIGLDLTIGAIILIGASWIFGGIAEDVVTGDPLTIVDRKIAVWLHMHATPNLTETMKFISLLASWPVVMGICLFMASYFARKISEQDQRQGAGSIHNAVPAPPLLLFYNQVVFHRFDTLHVAWFVRELHVSKEPSPSFLTPFFVVVSAPFSTPVVVSSPALSSAPFMSLKSPVTSSKRYKHHHECHRQQ